MFRSSSGIGQDMLPNNLIDGLLEWEIGDQGAERKEGIGRPLVRWEDDIKLLAGRWRQLIQDKKQW